MKFLRLWGPSVAWMACIFLLSSRQSVEVSPDQIVNFLFFKMLHVVEYAILFILNYRATKSFPFAFTLTVVYAVSDEIHQTFVPTREGKLRDVIIDATGAGIAWFILQKQPKKLRDWVTRWQ